SIQRANGKYLQYVPSALSLYRRQIMPLLTRNWLIADWKEVELRSFRAPAIAEGHKGHERHEGR
ncbi:MAG: hypothetical protein IKL43_06050, partial [Alistipes sp.]|nr:hypothetical protein [Alistipes sp.]